MEYNFLGCGSVFHEAIMKNTISTYVKFKPRGTLFCRVYMALMHAIN